MRIENIVKKTLDKISLTVFETEILFREVMDGKISDEVLKKILLSLSQKGETIEAIDNKKYSRLTNSQIFSSFLMGFQALFTVQHNKQL